MRKLYYIVVIGSQGKGETVSLKNINKKLGTDLLTGADEGCVTKE